MRFVSINEMAKHDGLEEQFRMNRVMRGNKHCWVAPLIRKLFQGISSFFPSMISKLTMSPFSFNPTACN